MNLDFLQRKLNSDAEDHKTIFNSDPGLQRFVNRLTKSINRDILVQTTTNELRKFLKVDRVVLYYFYREWKGQVTFESLSDPKYSIFGSTGADYCFDDNYAAMYKEGRVRMIPDIETEEIVDCHKDFLRSIQVRANLVVPILIPNKLWGLLIAHHCQNPHFWSELDIKVMQKAAKNLANAPVIRVN